MKFRMICIAAIATVAVAGAVSFTSTTKRGVN